MIIAYRSATFTHIALGGAVLAFVTGLSLTREVKAQKLAEPASATTTTEPPKGWRQTGDRDAYVVGVDPTQPHDGSASAYVKCIKPGRQSFNGMSQDCLAEDYRGKRLRVSAWMKAATTKATWANADGANLFFSVQRGSGSKSIEGFHDLNSRPIRIKDTTEWQEYSLLLDVPDDGKILHYGFYLEGAGQIWVSGLKIEEVGAVPPDPNKDWEKRFIPKAPVNLGFK
jgi:ribosomal protein L37E